MQLTQEQFKTYEEKDFILLPRCFLPAEIDVMKAELRTISAEETLKKIFEKDGKTIQRKNENKTNQPIGFVDEQKGSRISRLGINST